MLLMIAMIFIVLWMLGLVNSYTMGGFIHIPIVIAVIVVLVNIVQGVINIKLNDGFPID